MESMYFVFILIFCYIILGVSSTLYQDQKECGRIDKRSSLGYYIIGGSPARYMEFPWLVSIQRFIHTKLYYLHKCGAAIIASRFILTASHCFTYADVKQIKANEYPPYMKIVVGLGNMWTNPNNWYRHDHKIKNVLLHEKYDITNSLIHDIALVQLEKHINFGGYSPFRPICLPKSYETFKGKVTVAGWGVLLYQDNKESPSDRLMKVDLPIIPNELCYRKIEQDDILKERGVRLLDTHMCLIHKTKSSCTGDSGGPAMCLRNNRWIQCGIISFGNDCRNISIYTNVAKYIKWIQSAVKQMNKKNHKKSRRALETK